MVNNNLTTYNKTINAVKWVIIIINNEPNKKNLNNNIKKCFNYNGLNITTTQIKKLINIININKNNLNNINNIVNFYLNLN
jgi:hypothetical protein